MSVGKEETDRAIDMIEKVRNLAESKGFDFKKLVQLHCRSFKVVPNNKAIKQKPDDFVPSIMAEMRSLLSIIKNK